MEQRARAEKLHYQAATNVTPRTVVQYREHARIQNALILADAVVCLVGSARSSFTRTLRALLIAGGLCACSEPVSLDLPHFQDLSSAPPAIKQSARAVVRIETSTLSGTGAFISSSGLLLTNNHVLGAPECPLEGCAVWLSFDYQRGEPVQDPMLAFAVPQAVDIGLDTATLQIYDEQGGAALSSPDFLNVVPRSALDLLGTHVFVVGHPRASLKRWTDGTVVDTDGQWFTSTAFALPGDSGSPSLDDQGNLVGLVHRVPTGEDLITSNNVDVYSIGTTSAAILAAASAPLPPGMLSIGESITTVNLLANNRVFQNGLSPSARVDGRQTGVLSVLAQACDAALARTDFASIDELQAAQTPCFDAMRWLECRTDLTPPPLLSVCSDTAAWAVRFQQVNEALRALHGAVSLGAVSFGIAQLSSSKSAGTVAGSASLVAALNEAQTPLDLSLAPYLAAFGIDTYAGVSVSEYVHAYRRIAHYELDATSLASAAAWLYNDGGFTTAELRQLLNELDGNPNVSVGSKLYVERLRHDYGLE